MITATCRIHGSQVFKRNDRNAMYHCPELLECGSVILNEHVTPDGADVVVIWEVMPTPPHPDAVRTAGGWQ